MFTVFYSVFMTWKFVNGKNEIDRKIYSIWMSSLRHLIEII